jgi:hypothetical protein
VKSVGASGVAPVFPPVPVCAEAPPVAKSSGLRRQSSGRGSQDRIARMRRTVLLSVVVFASLGVVLAAVYARRAYLRVEERSQAGRIENKLGVAPNEKGPSSALGRQPEKEPGAERRPNWAEVPKHETTSNFSITPESALKHEKVRAELDRLAGEAASVDMGLNVDETAKVQQIFALYHAAHIGRMERGPVPTPPGEELPYSVFERQMKAALGEERFQRFMALKMAEHAKLVQTRRAMRRGLHPDASVP